MGKRICVFGDSITRGAFDFKKGGWANRLKVFSWEKGGMSVYELGVSGDTSFDIVRRFDVELDVMKKRFDTIVFAIGLNDAGFNDLGQEICSEHDFEKNIRKIIQKALERFESDHIFFVGVTNINVDIAGKWFSVNRINLFDKNMQKIIEESGCRYIHTFDLLNNNDLCNDGYHPNEKGHEKIFQKVKEALL